MLLVDGPNTIAAKPLAVLRTAHAGILAEHMKFGDRRQDPKGRDYRLVLDARRVLTQSNPDWSKREIVRDSMETDHVIKQLKRHSAELDDLAAYICSRHKDVILWADIVTKSKEIQAKTTADAGAPVGGGDGTP